MFVQLSAFMHSHEAVFININSIISIEPYHGFGDTGARIRVTGEEGVLITVAENTTEVYRRITQMPCRHG